ncbi:ComF family protein [Salegentibacter sp.]|uniref:ComF family protein n=1 Tax=Salegentibacter sp. TaxID=1903072 RepID=UPI0035614048
MFHDLLNLFYPKICNCCETELVSHEKIVCTTCLHQLPLTNFHLDNENTTKKVFSGRLSIENATSLLYFKKKGMVQNLIHNLKYRGNREIGTYLGQWLGEELAKTRNYTQIEVVIPVPLHRKKLKSRGFNQVEDFGKEIANCLNAQYIDDVLVKRSATTTQTLKKRLSRWGSIDETFFVENQDKVVNKQLLLVDDLITTGATMEACVSKLQKINGVKISLASMAITD